MQLLKSACYATPKNSVNSNNNSAKNINNTDNIVNDEIVESNTDDNQNTDMQVDNRFVFNIQYAIYNL